MKILIDECLPKALAKMLAGHMARTVAQMGWSGISNGDLLQLAIAAKFDVFVTIDKSIPAQKKRATPPLPVVILRPHSNRVQDVAPFAKQILSLVNKELQAGFYTLTYE